MVKQTAFKETKNQKPNQTKKKRQTLKPKQKNSHQSYIYGKVA